MSRCVLFIVLALALSLPRFLQAEEEQGPLISITSPDKGATFVSGTIKNHSLFWSKKYQMLIVRVVFTDAEQNLGQPNEDTQEFRLPGLTYNEAKGIFFATSPKGELIPVAHIKKALFFKTVEMLPNANVRIAREKGNVTVILEAISPNDPAMHAPPPDSNPNDTHAVDPGKILQ